MLLEIVKTDKQKRLWAKTEIEIVLLFSKNKMAILINL